MISYHFTPKPPTDERERVRKLIQELGLGVEDVTRLFEEVKSAEKGTIEMRNHLAKHTNYEDIKGAKMIKIAKERLYPSVYRISEMDDDHKKKANPEYLRENEGLEACVIGDELVIADGNPSILTDVQKQTLSDAMGREFEIWENDTHILLGTSKSAVDTRMPPFTGALAITLFAMLGPMLYGYAVGSTYLVMWLNIHMLFGYAVLMIPTLVAMFLYSLVVFLWIMNRKDSEVMKRALGEKVFTRELLFKGK